METENTYFDVDVRGGVLKASGVYTETKINNQVRIRRFIDYRNDSMRTNVYY